MVNEKEFKKHITIPGKIINEFAEVYSISQKSLARRLAMNTKTVNEIIKGKAPITIETAKKLEYIFDAPASFWLNLENAYRMDLYNLNEKLRIENDSNALNDYPLVQLEKETGIICHYLKKSMI